MAQDSHDHHEHAHGDDHAHLEDHHHEGPIAHTEVVPEKSPEDSFLLGILSLCFVALLWTVGQWSTIKADAHVEAGGHEQTSGVEHAAPHGVPAPAAHEVAPGTEGAPVLETGGHGTNPVPGTAVTEGAPVAPESDPAAPGTAPVAPANGVAPGASDAPAPNPAWTGTPPASSEHAWTGTQPPAQPTTTPATTEATH